MGHLGSILQLGKLRHRDAEGPHVDRETVVELWTVWHVVICWTVQLRNGKKATELTVGQVLRI